MRERDRGENEIAVSTVVKKRELLTCDLSLDLSLVQRRTWALRSVLVSILKVAYRLIYLNLSKHYHRLMYLRCFFVLFHWPHKFKESFLHNISA